MVSISSSEYLYKTISKHDLLERWRIVEAVNLPHLSPADHDLPDDRSTSSFHSSLDEEIQAILGAHGKIDCILSQHVSDVGKVTFKVRWSDGVETEVGLRVLRQIDYQSLEAFQHDLLEKQESNGRSESPFLLRTARRARKTVPQEDPMLDILGPEDVEFNRMHLSDSSGDESYAAREGNDVDNDSEIELSSSYSEDGGNDSDSKIPMDPMHRQLRQNNSTSLRLSSPDKFDMSETELLSNGGPTTEIPYYADPGIIANHWSVCSRCKTTGEPNGARSKKRKRGQSKHSLVMSQEEGRLLLCVTCSAATHERCLPELSKKHLRDCLTNGKLGKAFQCTSCLSAESSGASGVPACDGCHQIHAIKNVKLLASVPSQSSKPENSETAAPSKEPIDPTISHNPNATSTKPLAQVPNIEEDTGLFRCLRCTRAYHYKCLPPFPDENVRFEDLMFTLPIHDKTIKICNDEKMCPECIVYDKKIDRIIAWRIAGDPQEKKLPITFSQALNKPKELLVKWSDTSYRHLTWVSEEWLRRVAKMTYKIYADRQKDQMHATEKELVPLVWKKVDRIMDAQDKDGNRVETGDGLVHSVFAKFQELDNDQACWDSPPPPEDVELYAAYQSALNRYKQACRVDPPENMEELVKDVREAARTEDYSKREMKQQPSFISGGTLMPHQMDGLNWLTYQWECRNPCVLADDMGLGKTIQIVSFLNLLLTRFKIYPFLIVVPNSTASNWLREFEKWAPKMTVVPFYGSNRSRLYTRDKELFRDGQGKLRCHAVILTYQSALSESTLFKKVDLWPVLVIDEAQRMKNNDSLLFKKLMTVKSDHRILMTGTPLQNNIRELINIMSFVDSNKFGNIEDLEERYSGLTTENVRELHDLLRPYFLRRTKEIVLKNLPPKSEIIVPVSMTPLQKEVCKNLMEKNLISYVVLHDSNKKSAQSKRSLNNILIQLRKALNHPYLIPEIEVQQKTPKLAHQVLIDACAKLKVLHQMLPKLFQNGHRVLIFSTLRILLDILEDYLTGEDIKFARLDGMTPSVDRTRYIDAFNATNSDIKVFLLTSRAGDVGINLATADTVIMWDFDYNPHVDMQAIGRACRIGQTKPVLVLRFMTRFSVEEKIAQVAKKKLAMDHLVVEKMDQVGLEDQDVETIMKFGAQALFEDDNTKDISYDSDAIDKLLDRSRLQTIAGHPQQQPVENDGDASGHEASAKSMSFSFAKVWRADKNDGILEDLSEENEQQEKENEDFWNRFLREKRENIAAEKMDAEQLGRGARRRTLVDYADNFEPVSKKIKRRRKGEEKQPLPQSSDEEFQAQSDDSSVEVVLEQREPQHQIPISTQAPDMAASGHDQLVNTDMVKELLKARINSLLNVDHSSALNAHPNALSSYDGKQLLQMYIRLLQGTDSAAHPPPPHISFPHQPPVPPMARNNLDSSQQLPIRNFTIDHQPQHNVLTTNGLLHPGQPEATHTYVHPPQQERQLYDPTAQVGQLGTFQHAGSPSIIRDLGESQNRYQHAQWQQLRTPYRTTQPSQPSPPPSNILHGEQQQTQNPRPQPPPGQNRTQQSLIAMTRQVLLKSDRSAPPNGNTG